MTLAVESHVQEALAFEAGILDAAVLEEVEAVVGGQPEPSLRVFADAGNGVAVEAVLGGVDFPFAGLVERQAAAPGTDAGAALGILVEVVDPVVGEAVVGGEALPGEGLGFVVLLEVLADDGLQVSWAW
jgi:hypothetical protein